MTEIIITYPVDKQLCDPSVSFSNAITRSSHGLSLSEKRILMLAVSKLDSMKHFDQGESPTVRLTAKEYAEIFDVNSDIAYEQLIAAGKELNQRKITFFSQSKNEQEQLKLPLAISWVGDYKYHEGKGRAELRFWHEVIPYLMDLSSHFTTYKLRHASKLKSLYTWRMLEIFSQYKKNHWIEISVSEFRHAMDVPEKMANNYDYIRRRIIEPSMRELQKNIGLIIKFKPIKTDRKITSLRFEY